jgi:hypothetical protein
MSWIKDVSHEIKELDLSKKALRKFGLTIGGIFLAIGLLLLWKSIWLDARIIFISIGGTLFLGGLLFPMPLKYVYLIWMGFAFALGWIVSRFILIILFLFVMTQIGFIAKLFGKKFLDLKYKKRDESYWIPKEKRKNDYEKMY